MARWISSLATLAALAAGLAAVPARAEWPHDRPITFVVPYPPGNGGDVMARTLAEALKPRLRATVIVENRPGASGNVGQGFVARAEPDGYTFVVTSPGPGANNLLTFKSLPFNPLTDFTFVTRLCEQDVLLVAGPGFKGDVKDFLRRTGDALQTAIPGTGTYGHMIALGVQEATGHSFNLVPYRSGPQIVPDLLSGRVDISFDLAPAYLQLIKEGQLRALATVSSRRVADLPDVPTLTELGLNLTAAPWYGLEGPKNLPAAIVERMNREVADILGNDGEIRAKLLAVGLVPRPSTPDEFAALVRDEVEKWRPVVAKYNLGQ